jgi:hypothetical protein
MAIVEPTSALYNVEEEEREDDNPLCYPDDEDDNYSS